MTPDEWGFKGANGTKITILDWVNKNAPPGADIIKTIKGFKWEVKDAQGGIGEISIKKIEFLDENKQAIDPVKLTGIVILGLSLMIFALICSFSGSSLWSSPMAQRRFMWRLLVPLPLAFFLTL